MKHLKVVLGIVELGLVLKFVSNIDLAIGTRLIHRELFLALWTLSFFAAAVYLMDLPALFSKERKWEMGKGAAIAVIFLLGVTGFLCTGLNGEPFPRQALQRLLDVLCRDDHQIGEFVDHHDDVRETPELDLLRLLLTRLQPQLESLVADHLVRAGDRHRSGREWSANPCARRPGRKSEPENSP